MDLVTFEYHTEDDGLTIVATVRSVQPVDQASVDTTAQALREELDQPVTLEVIALPVTRSREQ
jgi:Flp pilus assembly secretin CpaC